MVKDLRALMIILVFASLIVVNLHIGVGVLGTGKVVPFPLWLSGPHGVGLLHLVQDVLTDDMLLEVGQHPRHPFRRVKPMKSEIRGFPGEMAISLVYPPFRWDIPCK